ncbi:MAG: hypothetical protein ACFB10_21030 [Salibacteraceae bacterium]
MSIEEYIAAMLPMVELLDREKKVNPKGYKKRQLWYLYRQYFYGFAEFIDREILFNASKKAQTEFEIQQPGRRLVNQDWKDQPQFDQGRKIFNLDHIYTGEMFRNAVDTLISEDELSVEKIAMLIRNNYRMAWILKDEERRLHRSKRGKTLNDALKEYSKCEIVLEKKEETEANKS